ncbi:MAG: PIG-L family deacetylase [Candidatus Firestonebacteria bacterium]
MRILAIGPHPDDIEIGCGGTLIIAKDKRYDINLLVMTQGQAGGEPKKRVKEQEKVAKVLHAKLHWGGLIDTKIELNRELIQILEREIIKINPDIIFAPYNNDTHQDHRNISTAVITAARYKKNVLFYEVPSSIDFQPTAYVNISPVINRKFGLLKLHSSQIHKTKVPGLSILKNAEASAIFRGVQNRVKYSEGFMPLRLELVRFK